MDPVTKMFDKTEYISNASVATHPVVSVCMWVYNHGSSLDQAVESVLSQRTEFPYELVISDDFSTDGTTRMLRSYQKRYPEKIRLVLSTENLWASGVITKRLMSAAAGRYVALHHGDDYWTDHLKLQKQVSLMEQDPDCAVCFHSVMEDRMGVQSVFAPKEKRARYDACDLFRENFIRTCSVMYRNVLHGSIPDWVSGAPFGDWPLHLLHAVSGHIRYIDEPMACYRVHSGGSWSSSSYVANMEKSIAMSRIYLKVFSEDEHQNIPIETILHNRRAVVEYCLVWGRNPFKGRTVALQVLLSGHLPVTSWTAFFRLIFWSLFPWAKWLRGTRIFSMLHLAGRLLPVAGR